MVDKLFSRYNENEIMEVLNKYGDISPVITSYYDLTSISLYLKIDKKQLEGINKTLFTREMILSIDDNTKVKAPKIYLVNIKDMVRFIMNLNTRNKKINILRRELKHMAITGRIY